LGSVFLCGCGEKAIEMDTSASELKASDVIPKLEHQNPQVRTMAAIRLGVMGPDALEAVAALEKLKDDPNERVRNAAAEALKKIQKTP